MLAPNLLSLWDIMRQFRADHLMAAMRFVRGVAALPGDADGWLRDDLRSHLTHRLCELGAVCAESGLAVTTAIIERVLLVLRPEQGPLRAVDVQGMVDTVEKTLESECQTLLFYTINADRRRYFANYRDGWEDAIARFPEIEGDVEEAGKCFGLGRYAASVFHSIHACELGVIELGKFLSVPDPRPGWSATTNALDQIMRKKHRDRTDFERSHFPFLEQMDGAVNALKNSWRNKIDHAHGRLVLMTTDFNDHVAEEILLATRAFMRRLATELPH